MSPHAGHQRSGEQKQTWEKEKIATCHLVRKIFHGESSEQVAHRKTDKLWSTQNFKLDVSLLDGSCSPQGTQSSADVSSPYAGVMPTTSRTVRFVPANIYPRQPHTTKPGRIPCNPSKQFGCRTTDFDPLLLFWVCGNYTDHTMFLTGRDP